MWSVSKLETNFSQQKFISKLSCCLRRAESHSVKSRAPAPASLRHVLFVLFRCQVVEAHNVEAKDKRHHVGDKCKQMQANALRLAGK